MSDSLSDEEAVRGGSGELLNEVDFFLRCLRSFRSSESSGMESESARLALMCLRILSSSDDLNDAEVVCGKENGEPSGVLSCSNSSASCSTLLRMNFATGRTNLDDVSAGLANASMNDDD